MKKIVVIAAMLMVSICMSVKAQDQASLPQGTGLFYAKYQYATDDDAEKFFRCAMIALFSHDDATAKLYFRDDLKLKDGSKLSLDDFRYIIGNAIVDQTGYKISGDAELVALFTNNLTFRNVGDTYWRSHWDTYLPKEGGRTLVSFNPLKSNRFHRDHWRLGVLMMPNGRVYESSVYCANPTPPKAGLAGDDGFETFNTQSTGRFPFTTSAPAPAANAVSMIVVQPDRYADLNQQAAVKNSRIHPAVIVGGAIVAAALITKFVILPALKKKVDDGRIRDTNWQDGATSPWPAGSGGGNVDGPKF